MLIRLAGRDERYSDLAEDVRRRPTKVPPVAGRSRSK